MAIHITSGTTVGGVVTTITFANRYRNITIINRSSGDMWARVDGVDPTVAGDECYFVSPLGYVDAINLNNPPEPALGVTANTVVKMISAANATFTVQAGV
jgi:hypothetical protein